MNDMRTDFSEIKRNIEEKLPEALPKVVKWIIVHLLMLFYHIRMPIWVTILKLFKARKGKHGIQEQELSAAQRRRQRRERRRRRF